MSKDENKPSVLAIVPCGDSEKYDIPDKFKQKLDTFHVSENPEGLMKEYPELFIPTVPVF
ncbi:hypothetical protein [Bacillus sp. JJ1122]|uniref:hypothetical protein n=1 Tax=Bacillus sp. JJ1122 TaxID=3122951 RepID=UPI002FFE4B6E